MRRFLVAFLSLFCAPVQAQFLDPLTQPDFLMPMQHQDRADEVRIRGNRRTEPDAVLAVVSTKPGDAIQLAKIRSDINAIFALGYYRDVQADLSTLDGRQILTFIVEEKPSIREVIYQGNDELDDEDLSAVVDLRPDSVLDYPKINRNQEKLKDLYIEKGYFLAEVIWRLEEVKETNQVDVIFEIVEKDEVRVTRIEIVGNEALSDSEIKSGLETREEAGLFGKLTGAGSFTAAAFERDQLRIGQFYYDKGYIKARVGEPKVELSGDKTELFLSIPVEEGERFKTGKIDIQGDFIKSKGELMKLVKLGEGEWFSSTKLRDTITGLGELYKDEAYAYVDIVPNTRVNDDEKTIDITFEITQGEKVRFGKIKMVGNTTTRDKVIRRELRIYEGEPYSSSQLNRSKMRVNRLGYFETVEITTTRGATPDTMDVTVEVKEKPTGTFNIALGFSSVESLVGQATVSRENLFGRGQTVSLQASMSKIRTIANLRFSDDYFLDTDIRFAINVFRYETMYQSFTRNSTGGDLTLGYPLNDDWSVSGTYTIEDVDVTEGGYSSANATTISNLFNDGLTSSIRGTLYYDTRDNRLFPRSGMFASGSVEVATSYLGSENEFIRYRLRDRHYFDLSHDMVFKINADWGLITSSQTSGVPIFERFFVGGPLSVRGFDRNTLGPEIAVPDSVRPDAGTSSFNIGGTEQLFFNIEYEFPIFQEAGIRGVVFFDYGNAFDREDNFFTKISSMRAAWGLGIRWLSPIGPLRFELGFPVSPKEDEANSVFDFSIGNFF